MNVAYHLLGGQHLSATGSFSRFLLTSSQLRGPVAFLKVNNQCRGSIVDLLKNWYLFQGASYLLQWKNHRHPLTPIVKISTA